MRNLQSRTKFLALLVALLVVTLFVMSAYIPEKNHDVYNSREAFIKALTISAFRLD